MAWEPETVSNSQLVLGIIGTVIAAALIGFGAAAYGGHLDEWLLPEAEADHYSPNPYNRHETVERIRWGIPVPTSKITIVDLPEDLYWYTLDHMVVPYRVDAVSQHVAFALANPSVAHTANKTTMQVQVFNTTIKTEVWFDLYRGAYNATYRGADALVANFTVESGRHHIVALPHYGTYYWGIDEHVEPPRYRIDWFE